MILIIILYIMSQKTQVENIVEKKQVNITIETGSEEQLVFNKAINILKDKLKQKDISVENVMIIVRNAMEVVESTQVKGEQQKYLAVNLIKKVVVDAPISDEKEKLLLDMLKEGVIGSTIDLVVAASRGQLNINKVQEVVMTCWEFIKSKLKR